MAMLHVLLLILSCSWLTYAQIIQGNLEVNTTEGPVQGILLGRYYAWTGIPYAGDVDRSNRFKAPTPPQPRSSLFYAVNRRVICAQPHNGGFIGVENCLTVSIYSSDVKTPKPVIVWLNAEEYTSTGPSPQPQSFKSFAEEGVVVVSMNFRLSVFGFLCLRVPQAPGNAGLKDIVMGLQWVKNNIAGFGGNPNRVTLMGHSSAAALVDILTMTPHANNLFYKAVTLSGSALAPWAVAYDPIGHAHILADRLMYTKETNEDLAFMLMVSGVDVITRPIARYERFFNNTPLFAPCLEDPTTDDAILTDAPINILKRGNYSHIPYIASYVTREGTMRANEALYSGWLEKMQSNFSNSMPVDLYFGDNRTEAAEGTKNFYFRDNPVSMDTIDEYVDYQGDILVLMSTIRGVRERAAISTSEVRLLEFDFRGTLNSDWTQFSLNGAKHGSIMNYLFDFDLLPIEEPVMRSIVKRFTDFARGATPESSDWTAITAQNFYYLYYGGSANATSDTITDYSETIKSNPQRMKLALWDPLYSQYYKDLPPASSAGCLIGMLWTVVISVAVVKLV